MSDPETRPILRLPTCHGNVVELFMAAVISPESGTEDNRRPIPMSASSFLNDIELRPVAGSKGGSFDIFGLALGRGTSPLEVLIASSTSTPPMPGVRSAWHARHGGRAAPVLLVVLHDGKATLCGPAGEEPPVFPALDPGQAERLCREALAQPDRHTALRWLRDALPTLDSKLPGLRNEGFLATHELEAIRKHRHHHWDDAAKLTKPLLAQSGDALLRSLGFTLERVDQMTEFLRFGPGGRKAAIAVLLRQEESAESACLRFSGLSPITYALNVAARENVAWVIISQGSKLRLYPAKLGVGVGRRSRSETFVEIHTNLLRDDDAAFLWLLFSAEALKDGGTLATLLEESARFAGDLANRLRERIYGEVIPHLAEGLAKARKLHAPTAADLAETYSMAMTVLFRLLFIAYAEDRDLLPYKFNDSYRARSLKTRAQELLRLHRAETPFDNSASLWTEVALLCLAVDEGKPNGACRLTTVASSRTTKKFPASARCSRKSSCRTRSSARRSATCCSFKPAMVGGRWISAA